jgi:hypothetical protein
MDVSPIETGLATVGDPAMIDVHAPGVFELPQRAGEAYGAVLRNGVAFVADGRNGLVAYDLSNRDVPSPVLGTLGGLGVATAVALWDEPAQGGTVAFVATGPSGIAVVDVTNPAAMRLVWKSVSSMALGTTGSTPWNGSVVDVAVEGDRVWFSHAPGGVLLYEAAELLHARTPQAAASFRLQDQPGHADAVGVPRGLFVHRNGAATTLLVAYDDSGVAVVDWTNARDPRLQRLLPTAGSCRDVAVCDGRVYVADFEGGLAAFR